MEAIVGTSEQVYSGWIENAVPGQTKSPSGNLTYHLKVQVVDTFKGPARQSIEFDLTTFFPPSVFRQFREKREMFLWLSPSKDFQIEYNLTSKMASENLHPDFVWFRLYEPESMTRYVDYDNNIFTSDLRVISSWNDLRKEVKRFVKRHSEIVQTVSVQLPDSIVEMCGAPNAFGVVSFAKTPEFLKFAEELAKDPSRAIARAVAHSKSVWRKPLLSPGDIAATKHHAVELLKQF